MHPGELIRYAGRDEHFQIKIPSLSGVIDQQYIVLRNLEPCNLLSSVQHVTLSREQVYKHLLKWIEVVGYHLHINS